MSSTRLFSMRLPDEDRALLEGAAASQGLDMSKLILKLVREGLAPGRVSIEIPEAILGALREDAILNFRTVEGQILAYIEAGLK